MNEVAMSILRGTAALSLTAAAAIVLTIVRPLGRPTIEERSKTARIVVIGVALHSAHFFEEFTTGFHVRFPRLFGLAEWPAEFFAGFNFFWIVVWLISAAGLRAGFRAAMFPVWFFAIAMMLNGLAHPALALAAGGYFPGLATSPAVGIAGILIWMSVWKLTGTRAVSPEIRV